MTSHASAPANPAPDAPAVSPEPVSQSVPAWRSRLILVLALFVGLTYWSKPTPALPPEAGVVMKLPSYNHGFLGQDAEITQAEKNILPPDTEFARKTYSDYSSHRSNIFCSIVLSGASQQSIHRPELCLTSQGWSIINQEDIPVQLESGHRLVVRNLTLKRVQVIEGKSVVIMQYYMYWFVGENVTTPSHLVRIFLSSWDRLVHGRAHRWAYVTVASLITDNLQPNGLDAAQTRALLVDFISHITPTFQKSEMGSAPAP